MKENTPFDNAVDLLDAGHKAVKSMFIESEWRSWMTFHPIPTSLLRPGRACIFSVTRFAEPARPNLLAPTGEAMLRALPHRRRQKCHHKIILIKQASTIPFG